VCVHPARLRKLHAVPHTYADPLPLDPSLDSLLATSSSLCKLSGWLLQEVQALLQLRRLRELVLPLSPHDQEQESETPPPYVSTLCFCLCLNSLCSLIYLKPYLCCTHSCVSRCSLHLHELRAPSSPFQTCSHLTYQFFCSRAS
jgi:hypothetical protein